MMRWRQEPESPRKTMRAFRHAWRSQRSRTLTEGDAEAEWDWTAPRVTSADRMNSGRIVLGMAAAAAMSYKAISHGRPQISSAIHAAYSEAVDRPAALVDPRIGR